MLNCIAVGLRGFLGSVCRYLAGQIPLGRDWGFPVRTLAINLIGSFLIGAVTALALKRAAPDPRLVLFLKAGVCGASPPSPLLPWKPEIFCKAGARRRPCSMRRQA